MEFLWTIPVSSHPRLARCLSPSGHVAPSARRAHLQQHVVPCTARGGPAWRFEDSNAMGSKERAEMSTLPPTNMAPDRYLPTGAMFVRGGRMGLCAGDGNSSPSLRQRVPNNLAFIREGRPKTRNFPCRTFTCRELQQVLPLQSQPEMPTPNQTKTDPPTAPAGPGPPECLLLGRKPFTCQGKRKKKPNSRNQCPKTTPKELDPEKKNTKKNGQETTATLTPPSLGLVEATGWKHSHRLRALVP